MRKFVSDSTLQGCATSFCEGRHGIYCVSLLLSCHVWMSWIPSCLFTPASSNESLNEWCSDKSSLGPNIHKNSCFLSSNIHCHHMEYKTAAVSYCKLSPQQGQGRLSIQLEHTQANRKCIKMCPRVSVSQNPNQARTIHYCYCFTPFSIPLWLVRWLLTQWKESSQPLPGWERTQSSSHHNHRILQLLSDHLPFCLSLPISRTGAEGKKSN